MTTRIKFRRDTAANWTEQDPVLALGEPGFEQDTNRLKIGDGETAWADLDYASGGSDILTDDHSVTITVGNTEYFAIVNRANNDDNGVEASAVAYDSANNLITLHVSEVYNSDTDDNLDILIISKFDDTGALLWQKQIDQDIDVDQAHDLAVDSDDNIIVGVSADNTVDPDSIVLIKFDSSGTEIWKKDYVGSGDYSFMELGAIVLSGTDIFITGEYVEDTDIGTGTIGMAMKVSATDGTLDWASTFNFGFGARAWGMDVTTGGDPVIVGRADSPATSAAMIIRLDGTDGTEVWSKVLFNPEAGIDYSSGDIVIDSQNNIFVSVNSYQAIIHEDGNNTTVTIAHVMKLNSAGVTQWIRRVGPGPCASVATGIDCDSTGNVYLAAITVAQKNPIRDVSEYAFTDTTKNVLAIAKYSTAGAVLWQRYIETDSYDFVESRSQGTGNGNFSYNNNRGRNMSIGLNGKLAVQATVKNRDPDDWYDNTRYWEGITFQIDQDGREMTVGSGNEKFMVKESRIPARFITIPGELGSGNVSLDDISNSVTVSTATFTYSDGELAQQVAKSAPYAYVFGNDGTLTIPNDGDIKLTQTQVGWFSIFGPANSYFNNGTVCNYVDPDTGDVYIGGEEEDTYRGYVARYNSQGQIQWSIRLFDDDENWGSRCNALKIHPSTGNLMVMAYYDGSEDHVMLLEIDPDTARIVNSTGFRDENNNSGAYGVDFDFLSDGKIAVVGRKYDEYQTYSITPVSPSGVGVLFIDRSEIAGNIPAAGEWYVSGTGITGVPRTMINSVDRYPALTTTVRQGSGAVFTVEKSGGGYSIIVTNGGTNYLAGHKIKIPGTSLDGTTPENDVVITVEGLTSGAISSVSNVGTSNAAAVGPYTGLSGTNHNVGSDFTITLDLNTDGTVDGYYDLPNLGNNYVIGDFITIAGTQFAGGATPANDITTTVASTSLGNVTSLGSYTGTAPTTKWRLQTNSETPDYGGSGTWSLQKDLNGEAFVYVSTAPGETFAPVWTKVLSAGGIYDSEQYNSVAVDASNNIYAVGNMIARNNVAGADLNNVWCAVVSKFNSAGVHQWTRALNTFTNDSYGKSVAVRGNTVVVSHTDDGNGRTVITKLNATGAVKWQRQTTRNGSDSSVAIDTNGDIYAVVEANVESQYNECIKVIRFNSVGEVVWRKILATQVGADQAPTSEFLRSGRNLSLDATHLYISGVTNAFAFSYQNVFLVKIPKSGDQDGVYGSWTLMMDAYDVEKLFATEATAFAPVIGAGNFEAWNPDFYTDWWDPSDGDNDYNTFEEIRDRDGGAIVFADGTRQTSSAQMLPQKKITNGADHRLCLDDMGHHIYIRNSDTYISVPYHVDVPLPIGFTVTIVNYSGGVVSIDGDGGGIEIVVPDNDLGTYWDLASPGTATLLKVEENTWFMTGGPLTID